MEVMLDTNILFSAILFPSERMNALFKALVCGKTALTGAHITDG